MNNFTYVEVATRIGFDVFCGESLNAEWTFEGGCFGGTFSGGDGESADGLNGGFKFDGQRVLVTGSNDEVVEQFGLNGDAGHFKVV